MDFLHDFGAIRAYFLHVLARSLMCQKSLVANLCQVKDVTIEATLDEFAYGLLIDQFIGESLLLSLSVKLNASFVSASLDVLR